MTLIVAALSLGPHLHVNGSVTPIWLPWAALAQLPLVGSALPARLMAIAFLGIGIVAASAYAFARTPARRYTTGFLLVASLLAIAPSLPHPSAPASAPAFFRPGGDVERINPGAVVLITPFSSKESTDAMYWQSVASYRFRMPEGDAFTPGPYLGPHPSFLESALDQLDAGRPLTMTPDCARAGGRRPRGPRRHDHSGRPVPRARRHRRLPDADRSRCACCGRGGRSLVAGQLRLT